MPQSNRPRAVNRSRFRPKQVVHFQPLYFDLCWYTLSVRRHPVCAHEANTTGIKIKIQVSMRERPILPVQEASQIEQSYFKFLAFAPSSIPSLAVEEVIAEKIRAASQRSKIRDLYDLAEISRRPLNKELVRSLAVLKLWQSSRVGLDYGRFRERIENGDEYDVRDCRILCEGIKIRTFPP